MELQTIGLCKNYSAKPALRGLDLTLRKGVYGLLGTNGAGKTTLMRLLCGLQKPSGGQILCNGAEIETLGERYRHHLGYLPQHFGYYPEFTALDFLLYIAALKGLDTGQAKKRSLELLEAVGLSGERGRKVKTFSGGMKQRLGIAQAMLNTPSILILDEPTAGLDPKERVRFRNLISAFARERIVLLSTHIVSDVEFIAETLILLRDGELLRFGSPQAILDELRGRVWEYLVPGERAQQAAATFNTSNLRNTGQGQAVLRIITDHPPAGALAVQPKLEDLSLYYFQKGAREP